MCGIAGLVTSNGRAPDGAILDKLARALSHRGPDGEGRHVAGNVGFVHRRLAIIDIHGGHQPLFGPSGRALVCNGEIYNDLELRVSLANKADFRTGSDCEPILHVYDAADASFVDRLRGMYAFALHDPVHETVTLARDPFGIKPLYVAQGAFGVAFASEASALVAAGLVPGTEDEAATGKFFELQFASGTHPPIAGLSRLPPGAVWAIKDGRIIRREGEPFWARPLQSSIGGDPIATFDRVFERSVELHLRSDVPYGLFLSGGIDSAAVLAAMARLVSQPVHAFTAYFPGTDAADERARASAVARSVGADHVELAVSAEDFWRHLPAIAACLDDPVADYAIIPSWLLAREAAKSVKVVLSGEGGDELFAGYGRYRTAGLPWPLRKPIWRKGRMDGLGVLRARSPAWRADLDAAEARLAGGTGLQQAQRLDMAEWLANDLLTKLDRCLMAHGVEGRVPFLDVEVAGFALGLPDDQKIRGRLGKWLLRSWVERSMPAAEALAPKQGFTVPVAAWIGERASALGALVAERPCIAARCEPDAVRRMFASAARDTRAGFAAWTLLFYAVWHHAHIERQPYDGGLMEVLSAR